MTNLLVHYAAGVTIAALFGLRGRARWGWGLLAVLPDVDGVTGFFLEPILHARAWTPAQADAIAFTLAHRGFLHTLAFEALVGALVWLARGARPALLAALLVASHLLLDALSPWPIRPLWPLTPMTLHVGLLRVNDPAELVAAALAIFVLVVATIRRRTAERAFPIVALALLLLPYALSAVAAANASRAAPGLPMIDHFPHYQLLDRDELGTHVWRVRADGLVYERTDAPTLDVLGNLTPSMTAALLLAQCEVDHLGPLRWLDALTYRIQPQGEAWIVTAHDARWTQDPASAPASIELTILEGTVTRVRLLTGEDAGIFHGERDLDLPGTIAQHAPCRA